MTEITVTEDAFGSVVHPITGLQDTVRRFTFRNGSGLTIQVIAETGFERTS